VLLALLYDSSARVQEIIDLKVKDFRLEKPAVITLHGKGKNTRQVPVSEKTKNLLQSYLKYNSNNTGMSNGEAYVFVNQKKQQLSRWGISYIIGKYVDMARLQDGFDVRIPVTAHVFRHSKSVHLLQSGVNLIYIRDILGHCDCSTTQIYAKADTETRRKVLEAAYVDILPTNELLEWSTGRSDITLESLTAGYPSIIVEFKQGEDIDRLKDEALQQILDNQYYTGLAGEVICVGLAQDKKRCKMAYKTLNR